VLQEVGLAIRSTALTEDSSRVATVRELLDAARSEQATSPDAARTKAQQARVLARTLNDPAGEAEALYRLASIAYSVDQHDDAFAIALDARELARRVNATVVEVWCLSLVGIVYYTAGNFSESLECALQALELYRSTDHKVEEGNLLNTVAAIHHSLGDTDRALVTYEAALTANKELERPENDALTLSNMAEVRASRQENLLAVSLCESALELSRVHLPEFVPDILARLSDSYRALDALDRAEQCLDEAEVLMAARAEATGEARSTALALAMARGRVAVARGDLERAIGEFSRALELAQESSMREGVMRAHTELAQVYKGLGRYEEALEHQEARFATHEELFSRGTDLRIKTLQIAHDTEAARHQAEILRLRTGELEAMVRGRTYDLEEYQLEAFQRLAVLGEFRDTDTGEHTVRVGDLAGDIAAELGEPTHWVRQLRLASRLHDIGKVVVPDSILLKPGPLTPGEFETMKRHTTVGAEILSGSSSPLMQLASTIVLHHHERWDGNGYPNALAGTAIPLAARIASIADVFDALTTHRTYKHAWDPIEAVHYIVGNRGTQFDPVAVDAFTRVVLKRHPELEAELAALQS
jgi:putative two-component system response regulator